MKSFYPVEAALVLRVLLYNLFLLFKQQFLGRRKGGQQLKTLRYKYLVLPARWEGTGESRCSGFR